MTTLKASLLYAAPDIAAAVAASAMSKSQSVGGSGGKPGSKPPVNTQALTDLHALTIAFARLTGRNPHYSLTDIAGLWDVVREQADLCKGDSHDHEKMQELLNLLAKLDQRYPRRDTGTEHETPCPNKGCGKPLIVTLPVEDYGIQLTHVCTSCGLTFSDTQLRAAHQLAVAVAEAELVAQRRGARELKKLEAKYGIK